MSASDMAPDRAAAGSGAAASAAAPNGAALPCHTADKSIGHPIWGKKKGNSYSATARELRFVIGSFAGRWGFDHLGFMTLTFDGKELPQIDDVKKKWKSLRTNALQGRYRSWASVLQRSKVGRLHYHVVIVCPYDIRTGFDFDAVKSRNYGSVCQYLKDEWKFWREAAPKYGFGSFVEIKPFWTSVEQAARYVARYLARHFRARWPEDKRKRLVSYAENARPGLRGVRLNVETGDEYERRLGCIIHDLKLEGLWTLRQQLGRSWKRKLEILLDPDETEDKCFWEAIRLAENFLSDGYSLEKALLYGLGEARAEPNELQTEF